MITEEIRDLWMNAHACQEMDSSVDVGGNSQTTSSVIATPQFVFPELEDAWPSREEIVNYLVSNDREHEVEYLMEEY